MSQFKEGLFKYGMKWFWELIMYENGGYTSLPALAIEDVVLKR